MQTDSAAAPKLSFEASCPCGAASWRLEGEPLLNAYCHCTGCQRRSGGPFIHALHYPGTSIFWTHENPDAVFSTEAHRSQASNSSWSISRCRTCYTAIGANNLTLNYWSLKAHHLKRDPVTNRIINFDKIKPTAHLFYDTRVLDIPDGLPKWDGYVNKSNLLELA